MDKRPLIVDVKRYALHDGPGIRTTVFFKGCPLNCLWCHNPEAISPEPEIAFYPGDCIGCGECAESCPNGAIQLDNPGRINRALCQQCGECSLRSPTPSSPLDNPLTPFIKGEKGGRGVVGSLRSPTTSSYGVSVCPGTGLRVVGTYYELDQLVELLLRDRVYYEVSGGGVTISGGEPTFHINYASQLLRKLKEHKIHTAIETSGYFHYATFQSKILPFLSLILYDIKLMDPEEHRIYTGCGNQLILGNFRRLIEDSSVPVIPRIPLIPGITTTPENLQAISEFIQKCGLTQCWLLPYNPLGLSKRENLGKEPVDIAQEWMSDEEKMRCKNIFSWAELINI